MLLHCMRYIADSIAYQRLPNSDFEGFLRHQDEFFQFRIDYPDGNRHGIVANETFVFDGDIKRYDIAITEDAAERRNAMDDFLIYGDAGVGRVAA